jgi:formylglycine-generating enzyme required for sulfatase activity
MRHHPIFDGRADHRRTVMRIKVSASACAFTGAFPYRALAISFTALLFAILPVAQHCSAQESWIDQRQVAFARWQAANPNSQSAIADYLKKSAQLIALEKHTTDDATPVVWHPGMQSLTLWEGPKFPEMVVIPAGRFTMGSTAEETTRFNASAALAAQEKPQHSVTIMRPFALGKYPVTRGEFSAFVAATGYSGNKAWRSPGFAQTDQDPVVRVSYEDAQRYVAWLNQLSGGSAYRLPSEAEWEYAARAGTMTTFYWGETVGNNNANCTGCGSLWGGKGTSPVGSFAANRFGLYEMAGNVWQWVEDCGSDSYAGATSDGSASLSQHCDQRGVRGGAWNSTPLDLRSANRGGDDPGSRDPDLGFRLARTLP